MKHTKNIPLLLASVLVASVTFAQTRDGQAADSTAEENAISAARSQYTQTTDIAPNTDNITMAQTHRGGPPRPFPTHGGYPRGTYQTHWMDHAHPGHILIGAAIGFGVGAAVGAHNSASNGTPVAGGILIGGGLLGFLGGCVGKAVGDLQGIHFVPALRRRTYRPSGLDDDEESDLRSHPKADRPEASAKLAMPGKPAGGEVTAFASPIPAVP